MSPLESAKVLPCSEESSRARSSYSAWISSRNLNITRARRCGLVAAQAGEGGLGVGDRLLDLGLAGEGDLGLHLAGVGVEHVAVPAGRALDLLAADEMADLTHCCPPWRPDAVNKSLTVDSAGRGLRKGRQRPRCGLKSGRRFSDKIMLKQQDERRVRFNAVESDPRRNGPRCIELSRAGYITRALSALPRRLVSIHECSPGRGHSASARGRCSQSGRFKLLGAGAWQRRRRLWRHRHEPALRVPRSGDGGVGSRRRSRATTCLACFP